MTWLSSLKIAIIEEDIIQIEALMEELPKHETKESAKEALALMSEAIKLIESKKRQSLESMNKIKQAKTYLEN